jgi:hypothetical protein
VTRIALVVLVAALAVVPQAIAVPSKATKAEAKFLPARGVLHPGKSLAGVKLGMTMKQVTDLWGKNYKVCVPRRICPYPTWYYIYPKGEPLGASVRFRQGKVVTIFTLGSPTGWRTAEGLLMGEQIDRINQLYGKLTWSVCIGYGAMSMRTADAVTSIYTTGESVYGFALSRPGEPVCN